MKNTYNICLYGIMILTFFFLPAACSNFYGELEPQVDYYSKTVEYGDMYDTDDDGIDDTFIPEFSRIYDASGRYEGLIRYGYAMQYAGGIPSGEEMTSTEIYTVDEDGREDLEIKYEYYYQPCRYLVIDAEGNEQEIIVNLLKRGEGYAPVNDELRLSHYYEVKYTSFGVTGTKYQEDRYLSIIDYRENDSNVVGIQSSTYAKVIASSTAYPNGYYDFVSEQIRNLGPNDVTPSLAEEFACWYNSEGQYTHELYHPRRTYGTGGTNVSAGENYYYTKYDWTVGGLRYLQQDFTYSTAIDTAASTALRPGAAKFSRFSTPNGFNVGANAYGIASTGDANIYGYSLYFPAIGTVNETLEETYDQQDRLLQSVRSSRGAEIERYIYRYNDYTGETISTIRYINGGHLYDRTEVRYSQAILSSGSYTLRETLVYRPYDTDTTARSIPRAARELNSNLHGNIKTASESLYRPMRSNYEKLR